MTYGRLGPQGFTPLGRMAQAMSAPPKGLESLPPTASPAPPPDPEAPEGRSGLVEALGDPLRLSERDSNSRGSELSAAMAGSSNPFGGASDFIAREPGMMSILGLSTGSAYDDLGRAYDTTNFDIGAAVGGLAGNLLGGPVGGVLGGLAGRQADVNTVLGADRARSRDFGQGGVDRMSSGERRAFEEARRAVFSRPMPQNLTSTERAMRQGSAAFYNGERDSQSRGAELSGSSSAGGRGRQQVSGATRGPSGMGSRGGVSHSGYGDRGRHR